MVAEKMKVCILLTSFSMSSFDSPPSKLICTKLEQARLGVSELCDALFWSDSQSNDLVKFGEMTTLDHPIRLIKDQKAQLSDLFGQLVVLQHRS
jgi:hypothetical protein